MDEAGRGPLAGPVVAGAVLLRRTRFTVPIDDSKRLTPRARERAFREIVDNAAVGVGLVEPPGIDTLNILRATWQAMRQAVAALPAPPDYLVLDGPWTLPDVTIPMRAVIRGDARSLSVACASIVAKVVRDRLMVWYDGRHPGYGFARHKGYPTAAHLAALAAQGPSPIHRRSFAPVARALRESVPGPAPAAARAAPRGGGPWHARRGPGEPSPASEGTAPGTARPAPARRDIATRSASLPLAPLEDHARSASRVAGRVPPLAGPPGSPAAGA